MKFLALVWYGIWRRPVRTTLIFLQVCVALALFGVLQGIKTGMDRAVANTPAGVLYVGPAVYGEPPLPIADFSRLQSIPGVKAVSFNQGLLAFYQKPTQLVYVLGIQSSDLVRTMLPEEFIAQPEAFEALRKTRTGMLITPDIGRKYGWHIGDQIPITSSTLQTNGSATWTFVRSPTRRARRSIGAANSLYALVDSRRLQHATLLALGFTGAPIIASTLSEAILLTIPGALIGAGLAWLFFNGLSSGLLEFRFHLAVTPYLVALGIGWALGIGVISGLLPALRAARVPVTLALRAK
jgi:ABC-type lipoprotein release transport system permease subunit